MTGLYTDAFLAELRGEVAALAPGWGLSERAEASLLNISENATFRLDDPGRSSPIVVRVHRPGYHSEAEIVSELAWIDALREAKTVRTPAVLRRADGERIARFEHDGEIRRAVGFDWMSGVEPPADSRLAEGFANLGAISARLHRQSREWTRPAGFARKTWTWDTTVGPGAHWGDWRRAEGLGPPGLAVLERMSDALRDRLAAYGEGPERFGLIHADLRLANLLVEDDRLGVIDFDDCGFGWFAFDFAAAISFLEHMPWIPDLQAAWLEGYRTEAPFPKEAEAALPDMIMLRRLQLTAWIASHAETPTAQELGADGFASSTVDLAERRLSSI